MTTEQTFQITRNAFGPHVTGKLGKQRKAQSYIVSPTSDGRIMVQSDKAIGMFDFRTGKGVFNTKGSYFFHLNKMGGAVDFEFPAEFVAACLEACPALDSETHVGGAIFQNTVEIV